MRTTLVIVFLLTILPLILGLVAVATSDPSNYLALIRSGFLLLGLGLGIGWGILRSSPRMVFLGLGLTLLIYLIFVSVSGQFFGQPGTGSFLADPLPLYLRLGLGRQPLPGVTFGQIAAIVLILANVVMARRRLPMSRIVINNVLVFVAVYSLAAALGTL